MPYPAGHRSDLYAEVLDCFFTNPDWKNCWEGEKVDRLSPDVGAQVVRAYLSRQHFENVCPMVALPSDVTRSDKTVKRTFQTVFEAMTRALENSMTKSGRPRHITAQATAALCVGGMIVARAMHDRAVADELRDACMAVALELGGWKKRQS